MRKLIRLTLFVDALSTLILALYVSLSESFEVNGFVYISFHIFCNMLIPLFIGVLIFNGLKKKLQLVNKITTIALQILMLIIIFNFGLIIWSVLDIIFYCGLNGLTIKAIIEDFNYEFIRYLPTVLMATILIPIIDYIFSKRREKQMILEKDKEDRLTEWWNQQPSKRT